MSWAGKRQFLKNKIRSLLIKEQAPFSSVAQPKQSISASQIRDVQEKVRRWKDDKAYLHPDKTMGQVAKRMGTTSLLLYRYFQTCGIDFRTWRTQLRVKEAQTLLLAEPHTPASSIACRVGILDRSNFNRQFKAQTGETPEQWRKRQLSA